MLEYNFAFTSAEEWLLPFVVVFGLPLTLFGLYAAFDTDDAASRRKLINPPDAVPVGLFKALVPDDAIKLTEIGLQVEEAGFGGEQSVRNFYFFRLTLAMLVPVFAGFLLSLSGFLRSAGRG